MAETRVRHAAPLVLLAALASGVWLLDAARPAGAQDAQPAVHAFSVVAKRYTFTPARIEVTEDDVVKIELKTEDIAHSFTIDAYRIAKRVSPGHPVSFEFRADKPGTFPIYCNLQIDEGCRQMKGELIVKARKKP